MQGNRSKSSKDSGDQEDLKCLKRDEGGMLSQDNVNSPILTKMGQYGERHGQQFIQIQYDESEKDKICDYSLKQTNLNSDDVNKQTSSNANQPRKSFDQNLLLKNAKVIEKQVQLMIGGIQVYFPFKPYSCQIEYMSKVMKALNESTNALIESPTGTGKTLSLLCATLAWVRAQRLTKFDQQNKQNEERRYSDQIQNSANPKLFDDSFLPDFLNDLNGDGDPILPSMQTNKEGKKQSAEEFQIIYCSRTISQLSQVINELKSTVYNPKSVILASRDHTCANAQFQEYKGYNLQNRCNRAIKNRKCEYFQDFQQKSTLLPQKPFDIEDLHQIAQEHKICPFYMNKEKSATSDLILMSYNYMLYESMRPNNSLNFENSIIIFDEAHNVPKCAEDAASFQLETDSLLQLVFTLKNLQDAIQFGKQKFSSTLNDIEGIRAITSGFVNYLTNYDFNTNEHEMERVQNTFLDKNKLVIPGHCIFNLFFQGINSERYCQDFEEHVFTQHWDQFWVRAFRRTLSDFSENCYDCSTLYNWYQFIQKLISFNGRFEEIHDYYVLLQESEPKKDHKLPPVQQKDQRFNGCAANFNQNSTSASQFSYNRPYKPTSFVPMQQVQGMQGSFEGAMNNQQKMKAHNVSKLDNGVIINSQKAHIPTQNLQCQQLGSAIKNRTLKFLCFNAGVCFNQILKLKPRSIILTSGTLAPLQSFQAELQIDFREKLENPHVISPEQVFISVLKKGVSGQCFDFSFKNRDNFQMVLELGKTIIQTAKYSPGGMLVFFPSYGLLEQCFEQWERINLIDEFQQYKSLFKEPKDPKKYQFVIQKYYQAIFNHEQRGACLMGVCRGRISEGLDFSDNAARTVILVGIPYPQMADPIVILKKEYLQKKTFSNKVGLTGSQWYAQQATRAVNQAIGRVIRHVQDFGAIILLDHRYSFQSGRSQISKWLRDLININHSYQTLEPQLIDFFAKMKSYKFMPKLKQLEQLQLELDNDEENITIKKGLMGVIRDQRGAELTVNTNKSNFVSKRKLTAGFSSSMNLNIASESSGIGDINFGHHNAQKKDVQESFITTAVNSGVTSVKPEKQAIMNCTSSNEERGCSCSEWQIKRIQGNFTDNFQRMDQTPVDSNAESREVVRLTDKERDQKQCSSCQNKLEQRFTSPSQASKLNMMNGVCGSVSASKTQSRKRCPRNPFSGEEIAAKSVVSAEIIIGHSPSTTLDRKIKPSSLQESFKSQHQRLQFSAEHTLPIQQKQTKNSSSDMEDKGDPSNKEASSSDTELYYRKCPEVPSLPKQAKPSKIRHLQEGKQKRCKQGFKARAVTAGFGKGQIAKRQQRRQSRIYGRPQDDDQSSASSGLFRQAKQLERRRIQLREKLDYLRQKRLNRVKLTSSQEDEWITSVDEQPNYSDSSDPNRLNNSSDNDQQSLDSDKIHSDYGVKKESFERTVPDLDSQKDGNPQISQQQVQIQNTKQIDMDIDSWDIIEPQSNVDYFQCPERLSQNLDREEEKKLPNQNTCSQSIQRQSISILQKQQSQSHPKPRLCENTSDENSSELIMSSSSNLTSSGLSKNDLESHSNGSEKLYGQLDEEPKRRIQRKDVLGQQRLDPTLQAYEKKMLIETQKKRNYYFEKFQSQQKKYKHQQLKYKQQQRQLMRSQHLLQVAQPKPVIHRDKIRKSKPFQNKNSNNLDLIKYSTPKKKFRYSTSKGGVQLGFVEKQKEETPSSQNNQY